MPETDYPMTQDITSLIIAVVALLVSFYTFYLVNNLQKKKQPPAADGYSSRPLQLQAYERLVMLAERISIPSLVSRSNQPGLDARQMQLLLLESIKQEYEYNITQQVYVSAAAWEAIKSLKDQNMLIINQTGVSLPAGSTGADLNRKLLEYTLSQKKGALHEIVLEALGYEAKKII